MQALPLRLGFLATTAFGLMAPLGMGLTPLPQETTFDALVRGEIGNAKLTASDGVIRDNFGHSVAIEGDTVVVGASGSLSPVGQPGSVYVFVKAPGGWSGRLTETAKLTASDAAAGDHFGHSVAINGGTIVVGAFQDDVGGNNAQGSAYVFVEPGGGWGGSLTETAKLTSSDGGAVDLFGSSVAISGDTVVVGAQLHHVGGNTAQGAAYVFVEPAGGWGGSLTETAKLTASTGGIWTDSGASRSTQARFWSEPRTLMWVVTSLRGPRTYLSNQKAVGGAT
jgi:hypothetical protein